jgi:N-acyl-L-homoserine lactone synthetase
LKVLSTYDELKDSFRLRNDVYRDVGFISPSASGLEVDPYDPFAVHFGALAGSRVVGSLRLITDRERPRTSALVRRVVADAADPVLSRRIEQRQKAPLPALLAQDVDGMLSDYNVDRRPLRELSRLVVERVFRGGPCHLAERLMRLGIEVSKRLDDALLVISCHPRHVAMNAKYGFSILPGAAPHTNLSIGQIAVVAVLDSREYASTGRRARTASLRLPDFRTNESPQRGVARRATPGASRS